MVGWAESVRFHVVEANGTAATCGLPGGLASGESAPYDLDLFFLIHSAGVINVIKKLTRASLVKLFFVLLA
jgi:hypothetical protein